MRALEEKEERDAQRLKSMQAGKGKQEDSAKKAAEAARRAEIVEVIEQAPSGFRLISIARARGYMRSCVSPRVMTWQKLAA